MKKCVKKCVEHNQDCALISCRYWVDSKENKNCTFIAIAKNGPMTLRQIAEIEKVSHITIRNIQQRALKKLILEIKKDEYI
tara:strand:- start:255 stop:497 length:243 start_codon:yes stop_codon:yes gene_type:complete